MKKCRATTKGKITNLSNGPGKLCIATGLTKNQNEADLCSKPFYIRNGENVDENDVVNATRIGVNYADKWKDKAWRFYIRDNPFVSVQLK
jgi:DNA-3-methyladenine glycosylase